MDKEGYVVAFDPGLTNLAVWGGTVDGEGIPHTLFFEKVNVVDDESRKTKKPVYEGVSDYILSTSWLTDKERIKDVVVETQHPQAAIPIRIAATTVYGVMRGLGLKTRFSGSAMKNKAMEHLSQKLKVELKEKPKKLDKSVTDEKEKKRRKELVRRINKDNSKAVVLKLMDTISDPILRDRIEKAGKKQDDLADAILLGVGLVLSKTKTKTKPKRKKKEQVPLEIIVSSDESN